MPLTGSLVNFAAIAVGGALGLLFRKGLPEKYLNAVINVVALVVFALGASYAIQGLGSVAQALTLIVSVIIGTIAGTLMHIESGLQKLGTAVQGHMKNAGGRFAEGFTSCTLLYCVGAMAVTGAIQGGLKGDHSILFLKSVMDGVTAVLSVNMLGLKKLEVANMLPAIFFPIGILPLINLLLGLFK